MILVYLCKTRFSKFWTPGGVKNRPFLVDLSRKKPQKGGVIRGGPGGPPMTFFENLWKINCRKITIFSIFRFFGVFEGFFRKMSDKNKFPNPSRIFTFFFGGTDFFSIFRFFCDDFLVRPAYIENFAFFFWNFFIHLLDRRFFLKSRVRSVFLKIKKISIFDDFCNFWGPPPSRKMLSKNMFYNT